MHLIGTDLDLKGLAVAADQRRVERLVHIGLRHGDIVLEASGDRLIHFMDHAQGRIAVLYRINDNPHRENIIDLIQRFMLIQHFLINTEEVLHPAFHFAFDLRVLHVAADFRFDLINEVFPGLAGQGDGLLQILIDLRLQIAERQVVQLDLDPGNTEAVRQRRINLDGFSGLLPLLFRLPILTRAHIMETVRQLDDNNPYILRHGQKHLPKVLRLDFHLILIPV